MWVRYGSNHLAYICSPLTIISLSILVVATGAISSQIRCPIESLYQLGDSIADTGNLVRMIPIIPSARRPYGQTFPGYPTGRWSDGRLIIDYIAMALGLPLLNPKSATNASFDNGVNFAVAGSTTLNSSFFLRRGILVLPVPSLTHQLTSFRTYLNSICSTPTVWEEAISRSVVIVGEFGYNDIGYGVEPGHLSIQHIHNYLPLVTQAIIQATREVVELGASQVIVPGNYPLGCFPFYLTYAATDDPKAYDDFGCLRTVNNLAAFQNDGVQRGLKSLRNQFPNATILYADNYNAFLSLLRDAPTLGFDTKNLLKACCGVDGEYNYLSLKFCGNILAKVCPNPKTYIHWDGIHLTQEAYRRLSQILITNLGINCTTVAN